ncbi:MAG: hypothetical protein WAM30_18515 [Candidatus Dormiibacterota bacterium]
MSSEAERIAELISDLGQRLSTAFGDMIPPEASRHLHNAQREALTALFLIYEDQLGRRPSRPPRGPHFDDDGAAPGDVEEDADGAGDEAPPPDRGRPARTRARPRATVRRIDVD